MRTQVVASTSWKIRRSKIIAFIATSKPSDAKSKSTDPCHGTLNSMGIRRRFSPLDFEIWYFLIHILLEKCVSLCYELVKWHFTTVTPLEKILAKPMLIVEWCRHKTICSLSPGLLQLLRCDDHLVETLFVVWPTYCSLHVTQVAI